MSRFSPYPTPRPGTLLVSGSNNNNPIVYVEPTFENLSDVPSSFSGQAGSYLVVNQAENALVFQSPVTPAPQCSYRIGIDPSSNPGMMGGLAVTAAETNPGPFNIPLTTQPSGLSIGDNYAYDPDGCFTVGVDSITCNITGYYQMSFNFSIAAANNITFNSIQLLKTGELAFTAPPALSCIDGFTNVTFLGLPFTHVSSLTSSAGVFLEAGQAISLVYNLRNTEVELTLTSNITITSAITNNILIVPVSNIEPIVLPAWF